MLHRIKFISYLIVLLAFSLPLLSVSQQKHSVKLNATTLVGVPNIGYETRLFHDNFTFQVDVMGTFGTTKGIPYRVVNAVLEPFIKIGNEPWYEAKDFPYVGPYKLLAIFPEFRYYPKISGRGFFVGVHVGGAKFELQKWNHPKEYHTGYSLLFGMTLGYQFILNENFNLELFFGGGSQQAHYKAYSYETGKRTDGATHYNKSGEAMPYRGGLMLVYKFKDKNTTSD